MDIKISKKDSQLIKGLAILGVLLAHGNYFVGCGNNIVDRIIGVHCDSAMAAFLFLSGYGLHQSYKVNGLNHYVRKRILKVLYPVSVTMIIQAVIKMQFAGNAIRNYSPIHLVLSIIGFKARNIIDSTMWYIGYLWIWYIAFWFLSRLIHDKKLYAVLWAAMVVAGLFLSPVKFVDASYCGVSFPLGVLYSLFEDDMKLTERMQRVILPVLFVLGLFLSAFMFRYSYLVGNLASNILAIAVIWLVMRMKKSGMISRVLMKLGELSLHIYLIEGFFMFNEMKVFDIFGYSYIGLFLSILLISSVAWLYQFILSKIVPVRV